MVSEPGFRSSRERCVVRVVSRVRTRIGLVLSDHCFGVLMLLTYGIRFLRELEKNLTRKWFVQETMPPRRAPVAPRADENQINQLAHSMNTMAATLTAQAHAKAQRDMEKRERESLAAGSRVLTSFNHQSPPKYNGEGGPDAADLWL